jgi:GTPase SAR1 family protein
MYYRGAAGAVIVYDISDPNSFKNARGWFTQLKMLGEKGVKVVLVGNKADLEHKRGVDDAVAEEFAQQNGLVSCQFLQCFLVPIEDIWFPTLTGAFAMLVKLLARVMYITDALESVG